MKKLITFLLIFFMLLQPVSIMAEPFFERGGVSHELGDALSPEDLKDSTFTFPKEDREVKKIGEEIAKNHQERFRFFRSARINPKDYTYQPVLMLKLGSFFSGDYNLKWDEITEGNPVTFTLTKLEPHTLAPVESQTLTVNENLQKDTSKPQTVSLPFPHKWEMYTENGDEFLYVITTDINTRKIVTLLQIHSSGSLENDTKELHISLSFYRIASSLIKSVWNVGEGVTLDTDNIEIKDAYYKERKSSKKWIKIALPKKNGETILRDDFGDQPLVSPRALTNLTENQHGVVFAKPNGAGKLVAEEFPLYRNFPTTDGKSVKMEITADGDVIRGYTVYFNQVFPVTFEQGNYGRIPDGVEGKKIVETAFNKLVPEKDLPKVTPISSDYEFVGWYDGETKVDFKTFKVKAPLRVVARYRNVNDIVEVTPKDEKKPFHPEDPKDSNNSYPTPAGFVRVVFDAKDGNFGKYEGSQEPIKRKGYDVKIGTKWSDFEGKIPTTIKAPLGKVFTKWTSPSNTPIWPEKILENEGKLHKFDANYEEKSSDFVIPYVPDNTEDPTNKEDSNVPGKGEDGKPIDRDDYVVIAFKALANGNLENPKTSGDKVKVISVLVKKGTKIKDVEKPVVLPDSGYVLNKWTPDVEGEGEVAQGNIYQASFVMKKTTPTPGGKFGEEKGNGNTTVDVVPGEGDTLKPGEKVIVEIPNPEAPETPKKVEVVVPQGTPEKGPLNVDLGEKVPDNTTVKVIVIGKDDRGRDLNPSDPKELTKRNLENPIVDPIKEGDEEVLVTPPADAPEGTEITITVPDPTHPGSTKDKTLQKDEDGNWTDPKDPSAPPLKPNEEGKLVIPVPEGTDLKPKDKVTVVTKDPDGNKGKTVKTVDKKEKTETPGGKFGEEKGNGNTTVDVVPGEGDTLKPGEKVIVEIPNPEAPETPKKVEVVVPQGTPKKGPLNVDLGEKVPDNTTIKVIVIGKDDRGRDLNPSDPKELTKRNLENPIVDPIKEGDEEVLVTPPADAPEGTEITITVPDPTHPGSTKDKTLQKDEEGNWTDPRDPSAPPLKPNEEGKLVIPVPEGTDLKPKDKVTVVTKDPDGNKGKTVVEVQPGVPEYSEESVIPFTPKDPKNPADPQDPNIPTKDENGKAIDRDRYIVIGFTTDGNGLLDAGKGEIPGISYLVEVNTPVSEVGVPRTVPKTGYLFDQWVPGIPTEGTFKKDQGFKGTFVKEPEPTTEVEILPYIPSDPKNPTDPEDKNIPKRDDKGKVVPRDEFITIAFCAEEGGSLSLGQVKGQKVISALLRKGKAVSSVPETLPEDGYSFTGWDPEIDGQNPPRAGQIFVAKFVKEVLPEVPEVIYYVPSDPKNPTDPLDKNIPTADHKGNPIPREEYVIIAFRAEKGGSINFNGKKVKAISYLVKKDKDMGTVQVPGVYSDRGFRFLGYRPTFPLHGVPVDGTVYVAVFAEIPVPVIPTPVNPKPIGPSHTTKYPRPAGDKKDEGGTEPTTLKRLVIEYIKGYPDGSFKPEGLIKRSEAGAMFARLLTDNKVPKGLAGFPDTPATAWYNDVVSFLVNKGYMKGYTDGTFRPEKRITRGEFAQMIAPYLRDSSKDAPFADVKGHWAEKAINRAYGNGAIKGYEDGTFRPDKEITRAEAVTIFNRIFFRKTVKGNLSTVINPKEVTTFNDIDGHWAYYDILDGANTRYQTVPEGNWIERVQLSHNK